MCGQFKMVTKEEIRKRVEKIRIQTPKGYGLIALSTPKSQATQIAKMYKHPLKVLKAPYGKGYNVYLKDGYKGIKRTK